MSLLPPDTLRFLQALLQAHSGFVLPDDKMFLVDSRLAPLARREGLSGVTQLLERLKAKTDGNLAKAVVEAMASTDTAFFRDRAAFDLLREQILPTLTAARPDGALRIWSAGCSTGQEAYSVRMAAHDVIAPLKLDILATDLSDRCLEKAQAGLYTQFEVQRGLPAKQLIRWFEKADDMWRACPELRAGIRWRRFNLIEAFAPLGRFDVILLRNVLPGFDSDARARILAQAASVLAPDGRLILGAGETVGPAGDVFHPLAGSGCIYAKAGERALEAA